MKSKKPKFAVAPEGCCDYLTAGRKYEVRNPTKFGEALYFHITTDNGQDIYCCSILCAHLNGKDWILTNK